MPSICRTLLSTLWITNLLGTPSIHPTLHAQRGSTLSIEFCSLRYSALSTTVGLFVRQPISLLHLLQSKTSLANYSDKLRTLNLLAIEHGNLEHNVGSVKMVPWLVYSGGGGVFVLGPVRRVPGWPGHPGKSFALCKEDPLLTDGPVVMYKTVSPRGMSVVSSTPSPNEPGRCQGSLASNGTLSFAPSVPSTSLREYIP